ASILTLACLGFLGSAVAFAADSKAKAESKKAAKSSLGDLGLGVSNTVPNSDGLKKQKVESEDLKTSSTARPADATYSVVKVEFAKTFVPKGGGQSPVAPLTALALRGNPLTTEKFTSLVRVKSPQKANTSIELALLDPRGDTAMSSSG